MAYSQQNIPTSLKVVAGLLILNGAAAAFEIFVSVVRGGLYINFGVVSLFVGLGLLRVSRGSRTCALVFTWIGLLGLPVVALVFLNHYGPLDFKILGQNTGYMQKEVGLIYAALLFAICGGNTTCLPVPTSVTCLNLVWASRLMMMTWLHTGVTIRIAIGWDHRGKYSFWLS